MPRKARLDRYREEGNYDEVRARQTRRQRRQRITKPALNGQTRQILGDQIYLEVYEELYEQQGGKCAICKKPPGTRRFHLDHNHKTGEIRGLLCFSCNYKLGFVEKYLKQIVRYLRAGS
jgi:hypothetical protein